MNETNSFEYTFTAPTERERREIESIRRQYRPKPGQDKLDRLKLLDGRVRSTAVAVSISAGVVGSLAFGLGFAMVTEWSLTVPGIVVAGVGFLVACAAYPLYRILLRRGKKKYGEEIVALANELLGEEK